MEGGKWKQRITIYSFVLCLAGFAAAFVLLPKQAVSQAERRRLAKKPELTYEAVLDESFMNDFETYLLDHFPLRDGFRRIKAGFAYEVLGQRENNGIYVAEGQAAKLEELNESSVQRAAEKMNAVREQYFPGQRAYYAVVPDKNYFLAARNGYPAMAYDTLFRLLRENMDQEAFGAIDLTASLSIDDYYTTDTHWRQERILDTAVALADGLGAGADIGTGADFTPHEIQDFYGVYYGQAALALPPDTMVYLTNDVTDSAAVWNLETGLTQSVYQLDRLTDERSVDKYDIFLGGAAALQVVSSPKAATDRRLILFRDSYASSLTPLLLEAYSEITLIDLRYISSERIGEYVDFEDADILFLYSIAVLNNSSMLK
ncbi:MAG: DHHW family protein [Roseburia sp.]|nr:DHHW family protein [Roseburia sp.]